MADGVKRPPHFERNAVRRAAIAAALAAALSQFPAHAEEVPESVAALAPEVHTVVSGGYWSNADEEGYFRAVVIAAGAEHVDHDLFLQWIRVNPEGADAVVASVSVDELNGAAEGYLIAPALDEQAELGTLRLVVTVTRTRSQDEIRYDLSAGGKAGTYRLERID